MFKYPEDQCDVLDRANLTKYRELRTRMDEYFNSDKHHPIWSQISSLLWRDGIFRVVNEARRAASENPSPDIGVNGPVSDLIDIGFVSTQTTAIRRLTEKNWSNPKKAVISVRRALHELRDARDIITREVYVANDGLPYDYEAVLNKWFTTDAAQNPNSCGFIDGEGPKGWPASERAHKNFDKLAGVDAKNRKRSDLIDPKIFDLLDATLNECEPVCAYADKFIAHAADSTSREELPEDERTVSLAKFDECYKSIYQVAWYIYGSLLWIASHGGLPVPQYDHLKYLDKPWMLRETLDGARKKWSERGDEISKWARDIRPEDSIV